MAIMRRRTLAYWISIVVAIGLIASTLPPPERTAAHSLIPDDYVQRLLAVSGALRRGQDGDIFFPYPAARSTSIDSTVSPYDVSPVAGQSSRQVISATSTPGRDADPPLVSPEPLAAPSARDASRPEPTNLALGPSRAPQQKTVFFPIVRSDRIGQSILGTKPVFSVLLPDPDVLAAELPFSKTQIAQVKQIVASEARAIAALNGPVDAIINNTAKTLAEKRAAIAAMDYNGKLLAILRSSQDRLQQELGARAYADLAGWLNARWQQLSDQQTAVRSTTLPGRLSVAATSTANPACPTFRVFATRSTYTDRSADLPDQYIKLANRGIEYSHGYTSTVVYSITVHLRDATLADVFVTDVAPHNHNDNYWNTITDTVHPRREFTDLPWGTPEAEAAYFRGYNRGLNEFGQIVGNPAGVNLSQLAAQQLGMIGNEWVDVTFPWDCASQPPPPPIQNRIERSWGVSDWNKHVDNLVNPVTGNQSQWSRDLYVPAPGLPIDVVRYYNSQDGLDGIFGRGWSSEYDMRVYAQTDGSYKVRYKDGQRAVFQPNGSGGFTAGPNVFDTFAVVGGGFVLTTSDRITYRFGGNGRLQSIRDLLGNQTTLIYTGGNPTRIIDSVGRVFQLGFNGDGHVVRIEDPARRVVTYGYGPTTLKPAIRGPAGMLPQSAIPMAASAALTRVTDANSGTTSYGYDSSSGMLSQATDADGVTFIQNLYDGQSRVREQRNGEGKTGSFDYDLQNLRSTFTDNLGNKTYYVYDKQFRVIQETDALGGTIHYTYNDQDKLIEKTDKRNNTWKYAYDARGDMTRREDPVDSYSSAHYTADVTTWEYNDRNQVTKMTNALGEVTEYKYDARGNLTDAIEPNGVTTTSVYNDKGQMSSMTDAEGRTTSFEYDSHGNRDKIIDPGGGITLITYDDAGRVTARTDAEHHTTRYEYDGNGNVTKIIDALQHATTRKYNGSNLLTQQIDRLGAIYELTYDSNLNLTETKDPLGNKVHYEYDAMYNRTKVTDALGNVTTYAYDPLYRVVTMTDPLGASTSYEYDANGNVTKVTNAQGAANTFVYDALNRRKFASDALGNRTEYDYDALDRVIAAVDPRGGFTRYEYDRVGNITRIVRPLGVSTSFGYDRVHNRTSETDPNGHASTFAYDRLNREIARTNALGNTVQTGYDRVGHTTVITDANGNVTLFAYNPNYWLTDTTNALGSRSLYTYDDEGRQASATDANGHTTLSAYDARGYTTVVTDALGFATHFTYDANGNRQSVTDAGGKVTRYEYGARNLLTRQLDPLGSPTGYEYDILGRVIRSTDANGRSTSYRYDAIGRLTGVTDAKGQVTEYGYDSVGNLTVITDTNKIATHFEYNILNQLVKETNPLGKTWAYGYDAAGNMVVKVDGRSDVIRYDYDPVNQLIRTSYPDSKSVEYSYDRNGNQLAMVDWNGVFGTAYDALNRPVTSRDSKGRRLGYTYDPAGNRVGLLYPDNKAARYSYNRRDELEAMTDPSGRSTLYAYTPTGLLSSQLRPNDTRTDFAYDGADRLTGIHNLAADGAPIASFDLTLDHVGNRTRVAETRMGAPATSFEYGYDENDQLTSVTTSAGEHLSYTYDPAGNRVSTQTTPAPTIPVRPTTPISTTYQYNDIYSMLRAGNTTLSYDDNGNRIHTEKPLAETKYAGLGLKGTLITDYAFDVEDRLVAAQETINFAKTQAGTTVYVKAVVMRASYSYDGMGRRVAKLVRSYDLKGAPTEVLLREYVYDGLSVVKEYEYVNGAIAANTTNYYYANGQKVSLEQLPATGQSRQYWYTYDALGSATALLDASGTPAAEYHHDAFGRLLQGSSLLNRYLFTGQEYDAETGLYHFFARYYDPETGVWLTQDSQRGDARAPATWRRYMYVLNNPVNLTDSLGNWPSWGSVTSAWNNVTSTVSNAWDATKDTVSQAADWVDNNVVQPVAEKVESAKEWVDDHVVQPVVNAYNNAKEWTDEHVVQPVKEKAQQVVNYVNENVVKPAVEHVKDQLQTAREAMTKAADWIQEHKMAVAAGVGFAAGLAVGFVAAGVFCAATAGIGCAIVAGAIAGMFAGGIAAGGTQMFANAFDSNAGTGLFDNVLQAMAIGGLTGAIGGGIGGALQFVVSGGTSAGGIAESEGSSSASSSSCPFNSFAAETLVSTSKGLIDIEDIQLGDQLLTYDNKDDKNEYKRVTFITSHPVDHLLKIDIDSDVLYVTEGHPIWVEDRGWVDAESINVGDSLRRADESATSIIAKQEIKGLYQVFNLTVENNHTFFVTRHQYLVHNCSQSDNIKRLVEKAQEKYPKLAGKIQKHHIHPKYLGGNPEGPLSEIDAAYHQEITNAIRARFPYGQGTYDPAQVAQGLKEVYSLFPLP